MKAIALISGGLDSLLAARLVREQGVEVVGIYFDTPFCLRDKTLEDKRVAKLHDLMRSIGVGLRIIKLGDEYLSMLKKPKHGYGANMNPCIDCKIMMLTEAKKLMPQLGASFVITGEVLGQRPMSQHRKALEDIEKESGLDGLLLRPLSAQHLEQTIPESKGWVKRELLGNFSGRSRAAQKELAARFDIKDYPNAGGGCLLTDPEFSRRLEDLFRHRALNMDNVALLKLGRHLRFDPKTKLIVGRNEKENNLLLEIAQDGDYIFMTDKDTAGPTSLARGEVNEDVIRISCAITCYYAKSKNKPVLNIEYWRHPGGSKAMQSIAAIKETELAKFKI
ncbi:MAG: tRNA 4-thiouridine(8) synthase ThiI [Candidatus Omnitrophica bacterium]|nr:tRNA 4-thiouridine(8) synthase ThiI [Candidatus Omnitrophota bacterium]